MENLVGTLKKLVVLLTGVPQIQFDDKEQHLGFVTG